MLAWIKQYRLITEILSRVEESEIIITLFTITDIQNYLIMFYVISFKYLQNFYSGLLPIYKLLF
jgi:hypothetical protein